MMVVRGQTSSWTRKVEIANIIQLRNIFQIADTCFSQGIAVNEIIQKKVIKRIPAAEYGAYSHTQDTNFQGVSGFKILIFQEMIHE